ncbi:MAG: hypothetical protein EYC69_13745 [Bacteroidetes bacterium]|nr:MAG: hypothetical protein EYC69_13745 [Bacteroidota bacterium]
MKSLLSTILFFLLLSVNGIAQTTPSFPMINSGKLIEEAVKLHDEEKYTEAIEKYLSIPANDTNYAYALSELSLTYLASGDSLKTIETAQKGILTGKEYQLAFYLNLGNAYDLADSLEKSIEAYTKGSEIFPYAHRFYYEMGVAYSKHHNDTAAFRCFTKSVRMNPFHPSSHYQLARLAARNNKFTQALLAYQMFLLLESSSNRSLSALIEIEKIAGGNYEVSMDSIVALPSSPELFSDIEEIIRSKTALNEKYKTNVKLQYLSIVKPLQAMNEMLEYKSSDKDFWMQTYVNLFSALWKQGHFEGEMYHIFTGFTEPAVVKAIKGNKSKVDNMIAFASDFMTKNAPRENLVVNGKEYSLPTQYYNNYYLKSIGEYNKLAKMNTGEWIYFHPNGNIQNHMTYNQKGNLDGEWTYFSPNGSLKKRAMFSDGKLSGVYEAFYANGQLQEKENFVNDEIEGPVEYYFSTGVKNAEVHYKKGKRDGIEKVYYPNTRLRREATSVAGNYEGSYTEYYDNTNLKFVTFFVAGKQNGTQKNYHENGALQSEGKFVNDNQSGPWKYFFSNGKLQKEGTFADGKETGIWIEYFENGKHESETEYTNGAKSGFYKAFDEDGILYCEIQYSANGIKKYKYLDKSGKILSQSELKGNKIEFKSFYADGNPNTEGKFVDGNREGLWIQRYRTGQISNEINFKKDKRHGEAKFYYPNGKMKETVVYEDGNLEGFSQKFYSNGSLKSEGWFAGDERQGIWKSYHINTKISDLDYFLNGNYFGAQESYDVKGRYNYGNAYDMDQLTMYYAGFDTTGKKIFGKDFVKGACDYESFHLNGKINQKTKFVNGRKDGEIVYFYPNGKKNSISHAAFGKLSGKEQVFHYNGTLAWERYYKNGNNDSLETKYDETGKILIQRHYLDDELEGEYTVYHENGKKLREGNYHKGEREGYFINYAMDGITVRCRLKYKDGEIVAYSYLDKSGTYLPDIPVNLKEDKIITYYANGNKSAEINIKNTYYEGKRYYYHPNGKLESDDNFLNDELNDVSMDYYDNGQLRSEEHYANGVFEGTSKYYTDKGILKKQVSYVCDQKQGWQFEYDDLTGKLKKKLFYVNDVPYEL